MAYYCLCLIIRARLSLTANERHYVDMPTFRTCPLSLTVIRTVNNQQHIIIISYHPAPTITSPNTPPDVIRQANGDDEPERESRNTTMTVSQNYSLTTHIPI
jgi:hypothetical protein